MGIQVTAEEMQLIKEGKLDPSKIEEHRIQNPVKEHCVNLNELESIKQQIRETNMDYKNAIQKNKDLYDELAVNRKRKEELRNKLAELRAKKKDILGTE